MDNELKSLIEQGNKTIEAIRSEVKSNDALYGEKMARMEADLAETLKTKSALEKRLAAVENAAARPGALFKSASEIDFEVKSAFLDYMRNPHDLAKKADFEKKSITVSGTPNSVPRTVSSTVIDASRKYSPIATLANYVTPTSTDFAQPINEGGSYNLVGETDERAETSQSISVKKPLWTEAVAKVIISQQAIEDMGIDVLSEVNKSITADFGEAMSKYLTIGTGTGVQPQGVIQGGTGFTAALSVDSLLNLKHKISASDQNVGSYIISNDALATLATAKASSMFMLDPTSGITKLAGKPVYADDHLPTGTPALFGNFAKGFLVVTNGNGIQFTVDPYTKPGFVVVSARLRFGSVVLHNSAYAKLLVA